MRVSTWMTLGIVALANAAHAQLRLPGVPLPALPSQTLSQTAAQTAANSAQRLDEVRHVLIANLIRSNPRTIAQDPHGEPIVRNELLAFSPSAAALDAVRSLGFQILREQTIDALEVRVFVLQPPRHTPMAAALRLLREADPNGTYDFNHIYTGGGHMSDAASPASPQVVDAEALAKAGPVYRIGLIDTGVDITHPAFHDAVIHTSGCGDRIMASRHGTAVASLLIGQSGGFHGVLPTAELFAADIYCDAPTGGAVDALAAAFSWLAQQRVAVINVSLVGPDNALLKQIVHALTARGYLLVAAVGNDGPAAPPLYPASYPQVIGVTAVDAHHRVLIEAARGPQVMFAAPGADMAAADIAGKYAAVRGTSFASPIVAAILARTVSAPDVRVAGGAVEALASQAIDLGPPGRDLTYGFGLVGAEYAIDPGLMEETPRRRRINQ